MTPTTQAGQGKPCRKWAVYALGQSGQPSWRDVERKFSPFSGRMNGMSFHSTNSLATRIIALAGSLRIKNFADAIIGAKRLPASVSPLSTSSARRAQAATGHDRQFSRIGGVGARFGRGRGENRPGV